MSHSKTLQGAAIGEPFLVVAVDAPEAERKRLESIGVIPGVEVSVLANNGGPILIAVGEARVAVEQQLAAMVIVA